MSNRIKVTVSTVNEGKIPAEITTDYGSFRLKRGMKNPHLQRVMKRLQSYESSQEQCFFVCVLQHSGKYHTLLDVESL